MDEEPHIIKVGDVEIDTIAFTVSRRGTGILDLTRREYDLLLYMLRNPDRPLSKGELLAHVWPVGTKITLNTVEVYIRYLRVKLGAPDLIRTRQGFGYVVSTVGVRHEAA